jgi:two-component system, LytTR family, response regulator LytT
MIDILIIEDEAAAVRRLQKMIAELMPEANFLNPLSSVKSSIDWFLNNPPPNLIFLDIHLADGESFEIFKSVKIDSPVIFITAYDQFALQAFSLNSIDYLLKPIKKDELNRAISKFRQRSKAPTQASDIEKLLVSLSQPAVNFKQRFAVKYGEHIKTIETNDVAYFYTENKVSFLITADNKKYIVDYNLDQLDAQLDPKKFFRINRQFIIGFHAIADMFTYSKSRVLVKLKPPSKADTVVSTERSASFKAWLDDK